MTIEIFEVEEQDGISHQVASSASIKYVTQLYPLNRKTRLGQSIDQSVANVITDSGLFYMQDILVSTGENKNTDYFTREEVWKARTTPEHKPLNFEHDDMKIIGHIVSSQAVDESFKPIDHSIDFKNVPGKFHILNGSVIYKIWSDGQQNELIHATIDEIKAGEWFVSMECVFRGFDYVLTAADGSVQYWERNAETAYLTKHLRQYGGTGVYRDKSTGSEVRLARQLKDIAFSGKGLVRRPANPESIIINQEITVSEEVVESDLGYLSSESTSTHSSEQLERLTMEANDKVYQDRIASLEAEVKTLSTQLSEASVQATQASINTLKSDVQAKATEIEQLTTQLDASKAAIADLTKRADTAEASEKVTQAELAKVQASQKRAERLVALTSKGASQEQSESLVAKFENLTDEQFGEMVTVLSAAFKKEDVEDDKLKKEKKDKEEASGTQVIDEATPVAEPALSTASDNSNDSTLKATAKFLQRHLKYNNKVNLD